MARYPGVVIGVVHDREDPLGLGRVRVKFPWLPNSQVSNWASVASFMSGPSRGSYFVPEEGDEVLVAFEQGRFENPYVVGSLWNGVDSPPVSDPDIRTIVTTSGHSVTLNDVAGSESIEIKSSGGLVVTMDDVTSSITMTGGGRSIKLANGQVEIA